MGNSNLPDWGPTRDPKRNAQIAADAKAELRREQAFEKDFAAFKERRHKFIPDAMRRVDDRIDIYLVSWKEDMDAVIDSVPVPSVPEGKNPWYVALAGNLLWAATCFLDPAAAGYVVMMRVMSVSGGVLASGMAPSPGGRMPRNPPADTPNGAKQLVLDAVASAKGQLETYFKGMRREWASEFPRLQDWNEPDPTVLDSFDAYIWDKMFPWIPYSDKRDEQIEAEALKMVRSVFADYMRQWQTYLRSNPWAGEGEMAKYAATDFRPVLRLSFQGKPLF